jgi:hypothetical protein
VVGLHGCDNLLFAEARDFGGAEMLGMFDPEPSVTRVISCCDIAVQIEDAQIGFVANSMDHYLQAQAITRGCRSCIIPSGSI